MIENIPEELPKHIYISQKFQNQNRILSDILLKHKIIQLTHKWRKLATKSIQRQRVLKQWLITQENYLVSLGKIKTQIRDPLLSKNLINQFEKSLMFPNIQAMEMLSQEMIQILKPLVAKWNPIRTKISDSVIFLANFFKVYKEYCNNYSQAKGIVNRLYEQYPNEVNQINLKLKMDIQSYLIKPIQRPPKYKLLLESYRKCMPKNHAEFSQLNRAIAAYHEVVEANNKAMDLKEKKQKLIRLEKTYGNIIDSNSRFLLLQTIGKINQVPVRVYIFNDLLMVTYCKDPKKTSLEVNLEHQKIYSKVYYDAYSTLRKLRDGHYNKNGLVLIGKQTYIRIHFELPTDKDKPSDDEKPTDIDKKDKVNNRDVAYNQLNNFINDHYQGVQTRQNLIFENKFRRQTISSNKKLKHKSLSLQGSSQGLPEFLDSVQGKQQGRYHTTLSLQMIQNRANGRTSTCMTKQRNQQIINDYKLQRKLSFVFEFIGLEKREDVIYYIIAIETPLPVKQGQYLYLPFWILLDVEAHLVQLFPKESIPTVGQKPPTCTQQQIQNNFIKLHQQRGLCIQAFLNFVFRNDNISHHINMVALKLGISQLLYEHMMDLDMHCQCGTCSDLDPILSDLDFQKYIIFEKSVLMELFSNRKQNLCISTSLRLLFKLQMLSVQCINSMEELLFYMSIKQKRLSAPYLFNNRTIHLVRELDKLPVHLPYDVNFKLMNKQTIKIPIYHYTTCRNIIQQIGAYFKLGALRDFALCVKVTNPDKTQQTWILNDDELVIQVINKGFLVDRQQQKIKALELQHKHQKQKSFWDVVKSKFQQAFGSPEEQKVLLQFYIKKTIFLNQNIQRQACQKDSNRNELIVAEILWRFRSGSLKLSLRDTKQLCTYYYIIRSILNNEHFIFAKTKEQIAKQFKKQYLTSILPNSKWNLMMKEQLYIETIQRILILRAHGVIFGQNLQSIFLNLVEFISQKVGWCTERFPVQCEQQSNFFGEGKNVEIGINRNCLLVFNENQASYLIEIPLRELTYTVAGLTLQIKTEKTTYKFTGNNLGVMITIIEFYQNLPNIYERNISKIE